MKQSDYKEIIKQLEKESNFAYYFLGAFVTDGHMYNSSKRTYVYQSILTSKDKDWLEIINRQINNNGYITNSNRDNCSYLKFYGKHVYDWLYNHGCTPRKSLDLKIPNIPSIYMKDFIRGCIDGDGSISIADYQATKNQKTYKQLSVYLCGASCDFIKSISNILNELNFEHSFVTPKLKSSKIGNRIIVAKNPIYRLQFSGFKRGVKLLEWLYDNNELAMLRKKQLAKQAIDYYHNDKFQHHGGATGISTRTSLSGQ